MGRVPREQRFARTQEILAKMTDSEPEHCREEINRGVRGIRGKGSEQEATEETEAEIPKRQKRQAQSKSFARSRRSASRASVLECPSSVAALRRVDGCPSAALDSGIQTPLGVACL